MADAMLMYAVTTGIFAFLVAVVFGARGARKRRGPEESAEKPKPPSGGSGRGEKKIKKFKSDGTPVYE
jgi:hypothetical protein